MRKSRLDVPNVAEKVLKCSQCGVRHSMKIKVIYGSHEFVALQN